MRGFMLDSARALDQFSYYTRFIDFAADRGMDTILWHFTDDQGCSMRFETVDVPASPNAYTKSRMRELAAYARSRGVLLIPELASLGHTRYITRADTPYHDLAENEEWYSSICPVSPRTRELIGRMLDEVMETFDSPIIHVGLDEVNFGGHPLTAEALASRTPGDLFADYVCFLHGHLAAKGRRMMMWGDYLLKLPDAAAAVPKDILIADWHYSPTVKIDWVQQLTGLGFDVVSCPALISYNQPIVPGESFAYPNVRKMAEFGRLNEKTVGVLTTIWTPTRFMSDTLWPAADFAAAVMRDGADVSVRDQAGRFAGDFFGMTDRAASLAEALKQLADLAPLRNDWLPVLRCDPKHLGHDQTLDTRSAQFAAIQALIQDAQADVKRNPASYASLQRLADLLAHAWRRAVAMRDGAIGRDLLNETVAMSDRLSQAWDIERFADDPRKGQPATEFDRGDSLLLMFAEGTRAIRDRHEASRATTEYDVLNAAVE